MSTDAAAEEPTGHEDLTDEELAALGAREDLLAKEADKPDAKPLWEGGPPVTAAFVIRYHTHGCSKCRHGWAKRYLRQHTRSFRWQPEICECAIGRFAKEYEKDHPGVTVTIPVKAQAQETAPAKAAPIDADRAVRRHAEMQKRLDTLDAKAATIEERITRRTASYKTDLALLKGDVAATRSSVKGLEERVRDTQNAIVEEKATIAALLVKVRKLQAERNGFQERLDGKLEVERALKADIAVQEEYIETIQGSYSKELNPITKAQDKLRRKLNILLGYHPELRE